jgi:hypothetical protein
MAIIPGIYASQISGHLITGNFFLISQVTPSSGGAVTFSSIPNTYKHLQIRMNSRDAYTGAFLGMYLQVSFNGDNSASNYAMHWLRGGNNTTDSEGVSSGSYGTIHLDSAYGGTLGGVAAPAVSIIDILDYANTNKNKTVKALSGVNYNDAAVSSVAIGSGLWLSTAAISSITLTGTGTGWVAGTTISLYGLS